MIRNYTSQTSQRLIGWVKLNTTQTRKKSCVLLPKSATSHIHNHQSSQHTIISSQYPSSYGYTFRRCFSSYSSPTSLLLRYTHRNVPTLYAKPSLITKRDLTTNNRKNNPILSRFENTTKSLKEMHLYVKTHLSLDIWTVNVLLLSFIVGPVIWSSMKSSKHTEDDYNIPLDDPVEHSVKILLESTSSQTGEVQSSSDSSSPSANNVTIISPEEDAKRILNELLASDNIRTRGANIASSVIQSEPFQNACKVLVRNIWNDLINDKETYNQLVTLLNTVLQNHQTYAAVKDLVLQLVNDEDVYKELTKLVVKLGEEQEVLDATQQLLTESSHRTLNDPNVLDHSMEFATEVMGDDVLQRTGGDALWNTVGYAVQPSNQAVLMGIGSTIIAGVLYFYLSKPGGGDLPPNNGDITVVSSGQPHISTQLLSASSLSPTNSQTSSLINRNGIDRGNFSTTSTSTSTVSSILSRLCQKIASYSSLVFGTMCNSFTNIVALGSESLALIVSIPCRVGSSTLVVQVCSALNAVYQTVIICVRGVFRRSTDTPI